MAYDRIDTALKTALRIVGLIAAACAQVVLAQETVDLSAGEVETADVVVVGTLHDVWWYPWIDGWHERGTISVSEVLFGNVNRKDELRFAWEHSFGWDCLRPDWTGAKGKEGVWTLWRRGDLYTSPHLFGGFFPPAFRATAIERLRERTKR